MYEKKTLEDGSGYMIISTLSIEQAHRVIAEYFELLGYELVMLQPLMYERAAAWSRLLQLSPLGMQTRMYVDIWSDYNMDTIITVDVEPDLGLPSLLINDKDRDFWRAEIAGLEAALVYGHVDVSAPMYAASRAAMHRWMMLGVILLGVPLLLMLLF